MQQSDSFTHCGKFVMFSCPYGEVRIQCHFEHDTLWFSQANMAELLRKDVFATNDRLQNVLKDVALESSAEFCGKADEEGLIVSDHFPGLRKMMFIESCVALENAHV